MPKNTLAPGFVKFTYSTVFSGITMQHVQRLSINPAVWSGQTTTLTPKSGAAILWSTALTAYADVWDDLFHTSSNLIGAELWRQDTPSSDPVYQGTWPLARAGVSASATVFAGQGTWTLFGSDDSIMKVTLIESLSAPNQKTAYGALGAGIVKSFFDYFLSNGCVFWTRGNAYCASAGFFWTKTNDKVRGKRFAV